MTSHSATVRNPRRDSPGLAGPKPARPSRPRSLRTDGVGAEGGGRRPPSWKCWRLRTPTEVAGQLAISRRLAAPSRGRASGDRISRLLMRRSAVEVPGRQPANWPRYDGECEQIRRKDGRQQALLRVTERTMGLTSAAAPPSAKSENKMRKKRPRKPKARALLAAAVLQEAPPPLRRPRTTACPLMS